MALASYSRSARLRGRFAHEPPALPVSVTYSATPAAGRLSYLTPQVTTVAPPSATVHYVSPLGSASWNLSTDINTPCSLATANTNATAGALIYLRGGTYVNHIHPSNSGTLANRITYEAYPGETPIFTCPGAGDRWAILITGKSYIVVNGITSLESGAFYRIGYGACYNEIKNCWFEHSHYDYSLGLICFTSTAGTQGPGSDHNWIHDNYFTKYGSIGSTMQDNGTVRIAESGGAGDPSRNNTIENNHFSYGGHDAFDLGGRANVIRNNTFHNEGAYFAWAILTTAVGGGVNSTTLVVASASTIPAAGHSVCVGAAGNSAVIQSVDVPTNTVTLTTPLTWSDGDNVRHAQANQPQSFFFGDRCLIITNYGDNLSTAWDNLVEGNRMGHAGVPPDDDGSMGIENAGVHTIARFNDLFGNGCAGYYSKTQASHTVPIKSGSYARVYNNSIYGNGFGDPDLSTGYKYGVCIWSYGDHDDWPLSVAIKNNIVYGNREEWKVATDNVLPQITYENNFNTDPLFIDTDMTDKTSLVLPNLALGQGSGAINAGIHLTLANGSGSNSVTLVVDDARYFQDGTWGSSLSDIWPDKIAIGNVTNVVEISAIDYDTNTITLAEGMTWADDAPIWLYSKSDGAQVFFGSAPDCGAHPYSTWYAASASRTDVAAAVAAAAVGGTVIVPAGTATFDSSVRVDKGIRVLGAGVGQTVLTKGANASCIFNYYPSDYDNDYSFRLSGFSLDCGNGPGLLLGENSTDASEMAHLQSRVRVDHNDFYSTSEGSSTRAIHFRGVMGCIDNNTFTLQKVVRGINTGLMGTWWDAWEKTGFRFDPGDKYNLYFEDNTFNMTSAGSYVGLTDAQYSTRYGFRHNTINISGGDYYPLMDSHGNQPAETSGMWSNFGGVLCDNVFNLDGTEGNIHDHRGGQYMVYNNTFNNPGTTVFFKIRDEFADARNPTTSPDSQAPNRTYYWANIRSDTGVKVGTSVVTMTPIPGFDYDAPTPVRNVNFFTDTPGTTTPIGVAYGLLADRPATADFEGYGYWATDNSTLYRWTSGAWVVFYTPFTYPHPLRSDPFLGD